MPRPRRDMRRTSVFLPTAAVPPIRQLADEFSVADAEVIRALLEASLANPSAVQRARNTLTKAPKIERGIVIRNP